MHQFIAEHFLKYSIGVFQMYSRNKRKVVIAMSKEVNFISRGAGYNLLLTPTEAVMALSTDQTERRKRKASLHNSSLRAHASSPVPQLHCGHFL
jgi:hypothetical protein